MLFQQMRELDLDPARYIVGNELNSINPVTGPASHKIGNSDSSAPRYLYIALILLCCNPKLNCTPKNPKFMVKICQKESRFFCIKFI